MPTINDYKEKNKITFKKKAYRPWNIEGEVTSDISSFPTNNEIKNNKEQLGDKKGTLREQLGDKKGTLREQLGDKKGTLREQLGDKKETIRGLIREQEFDSNNLKTSEKFDFQEIKSDALRRLCGYQRKILFYVVNQCIIRGQLSSGPITIEALTEMLSSNRHTVKTSLKRLVNKGFFVRQNGKKGKGGFSNFIISDTLRNAVMEEMQQLNLGKQLGDNWGTKQETISPSSSSELNTTTTKPILPEEWEDIDISPLSSIKFTKEHLIQLFRINKLSAEIVQDSINFFAFDLEYNNISSTLRLGPLNFLMGLLKKGQPYLPPHNYESPQDKAMKLYILKQKELENRRMAVEKEAFDLAYNKWLLDLNDDQICEICTPQYAKDENSPFRKGLLENYFKKHFWTKEKIISLVYNL